MVAYGQAQAEGPLVFCRGGLYFPGDRGVDLFSA